MSTHDNRIVGQSPVLIVHALLLLVVVVLGQVFDLTGRSDVSICGGEDRGLRRASFLALPTDFNPSIIIGNASNCITVLVVAEIIWFSVVILLMDA